MKITIWVESGDNLHDGNYIANRRHYDDVLVAEAGLRFQVEEVQKMIGAIDDHDCHLDPYGTGHCDHPSHQGPEETKQD